MKQRQSNSSRKPALTVKPGSGAGPILLGMSEAEIKDALGRPDQIVRRFRGSFYYAYRKRGIELDFGRKGSRLKRAFFFRRGVQGYFDSGASTDLGVAVGDPKSKVGKAHGNPDRNGHPVHGERGDLVGDWFWYKEGIQFDFGREQLVDVIVLFKPRRSKKTDESGFGKQK